MTYRLMKKLLLAALALLISVPASAQMSVFTKSNNQMTVQMVKAGGLYFSRMLLTLPVPPQKWSLDNKGVPVNPLNATDAALYNQTAGSLVIPVLKIDSTVYSNVKLNLPDPANNPTGASWSLVDLGNVMSTSSPGYDFSFPIRGKLPNKYCTDAAGELSYVIDVTDSATGVTSQQTWKHVADDPCCPQSVTTSSPANIAGISDVEIYPNPGEGPTTGNFRMMVTFTGKVSGGTGTSTCEKNVLDSVYPGKCILSAAGTCIAETPAVPGSTTCIKNVPNSVYAGTCTSPSFGVCAANPPTTDDTCNKNVTDTVYAGNCVFSSAGTCVPDTPESCVVNVPATVYSGGCFYSPGSCNPTVGAVDYYSCVKNVPDSVYSGSCFSPERGICNASTGPADNGFCTGSTIKRSEFCTLIDNKKYCTGTPGGSAGKYCTPVNTQPITYDQYCTLTSSTTPTLVDQTGVETCVVRPVNALNYPIGANKGPLAVSASTLKATLGNRATIYISGGLQPYFVTASRPGVVAYELLAGDATGIGQALIIDAKQLGTTQLTVFDYNGTALPIAVETIGIPLLISPSSIDVPEGTLIDVRIEGGVPPLTVFNPTPTWVEAPATVATTPTTIRIAMRKSSGSSTTFLTFTDAAGQQASLGPIKVSASTGASVVPSALTLKVGDSSILNVTGGGAPITILNTRPDLMDVPTSLATTPGTVVVLAKKSTSGVAVPIYFTDKYGIVNTVNVTITDSDPFVTPSELKLKVGESTLLSVSKGAAPISILNTRPDLMSIPSSLAATPGTVVLVANKSTSGVAVPIYFTDKYGIINTVNVTITEANSPLVQPASLTLNIGESSLLYVTSDAPPITVTNTRTDLMDISGSLTTTPGSVRVLARKGSSGTAVPIYFTDRFGAQAVVEVTITTPGPILQ